MSDPPCARGSRHLATLPLNASETPPLLLPWCPRSPSTLSHVQVASVASALALLEAPAGRLQDRREAGLARRPAQPPAPCRCSCPAQPRRDNRATLTQDLPTYQLPARPEQPPQAPLGARPLSQARQPLPQRPLEFQRSLPNHTAKTPRKAGHTGATDTAQY